MPVVLFELSPGGGVVVADGVLNQHSHGRDPRFQHVRHSGSRGPTLLRCSRRFW